MVGRPGRKQATLACSKHSHPETKLHDWRFTLSLICLLVISDDSLTATDNHDWQYCHNIPALHVNINANQQLKTGLFYLFGRPVPVVLLSPQLGFHLQPDVLEVNISVHRLHVALGHIVAGRLPVAAVWEIRQLFPGGEKQEVISSLVVFTFFLINHCRKKKKWSGETM